MVSGVVPPSFSAVLKHFYRSWQKNCNLCKKSVFVMKLSHKQLYKAFLLVWSIFIEIDKKNLSFMSIFFFSTNCAIFSYTKLFCSFEAFLLKMTKYLSFTLKRCFSHQIDLHTVTLSLSAVLKHFIEINQKKTCHLGQIVLFTSKQATYS